MPTFTSHRTDLQTVWDSVLSAIDPTAAVDRAMRPFVGAMPNALDSTPVLALGKAAITMAQGFVHSLPTHRGPMLIVSPEGITAPPPSHAELFFSDHPLPTARSQHAAERVLDLLHRVQSSTEPTANPDLIVLLSGGSSSLCTLPHPPLTIDHLHTLTRDLLALGLRISELNLIRRALDRTKGGLLAQAVASPCRTLVLALSDVISNAPHDIASGPFSANPTTNAEALALLERARLIDKHPQIASFLRERAAAEHSPATTKPSEVFARVDYRIVASHTTAANDAASALQRLGYAAIVRTGFECSAEAMAREAISAAGAASVRRPAAIVFSSEAFVATSTPQPGGRARHAALCCVEPLTNLAPAALLSIATDGVDGTTATPPTPAGALITQHTAKLALSKGLSPINYARRAASDEFFRSLDNQTTMNAPTTITTGPTGTNVNDLLILLLPEK